MPSLDATGRAFAGADAILTTEARSYAQVDATDLSTALALDDREGQNGVSL